jgi:hypothetical protein
MAFAYQTIRRTKIAARDAGLVARGVPSTRSLERGEQAQHRRAPSPRPFTVDAPIARNT